ncbi:MAG: hypothetical protein V4495_20975 [Pseudomonadota bacterium]
MRLLLPASDMAWLQINKAVMNLLLQNNGADNTPLLWFDELNKTLFLPFFALVSKKACFTTGQIKQKRIPGILTFMCNAFRRSA